MIVVAIIAIIAAIAIPAFLRARITANEGAAVATLKSIFTSEGLFQSGRIVDFNENGSGEFGTLGELTGAYTRTEAAADGGAGTGQPNAFISASLRPGTTIGTGVGGSKSGYLFAVFLPSAGNAVITDATADTSVLSTTLDDDAILQESRFRAYSWPNVFNNSGIRCFAINETGEVLTANNSTIAGGVATPVYNGATSPIFNAAAAASGGNVVVEAATDVDFPGLFISGRDGVDTQTWVAAGN